MSANLDKMLALKNDGYALHEGFGNRARVDALHDLTYTTEMLEADVEEGRYGVLTHPRLAQELLRLDTVERRRRVAAEAHTLCNLLGGINSNHARTAATDLLRQIAENREADELYGERTARQYRDREKSLREVTGNPSAIYYPRTWGVA